MNKTNNHFRLMFVSVACIDTADDDPPPLKKMKFDKEGKL